MEVLMSSLGFRVGVVCAAIAAFAPQTKADEKYLPLVSPDGQDACFGRVYDDAHLKAHPNQKMQRIFLLYGHDRVSRPNEEPPPRQSSEYSVFVSTSMRGARTPKWVGAWCHPDDAADGKPASVHCGMECDRGMGTIRRDAKDGIILSDFRDDLYLDPDAEETLGNAEYKRPAFGPDDDNFDLASQPLAVCKAEFARIDPPDPALGPPLREKLKPDQAFCYGPDYDSGHIASHSSQSTTSIRVYRGPRQLASFAKVSPQRWPDNAEVAVSVTTRKDANGATKPYVCQGEADQWNCAPSSDCDLERREIYLRRGAGGTLIVANPKSGLPLVDTCAASETAGSTRSDDKIFRLTPMPLSACGM
jgi:hypothetical protein